MSVKIETDSLHHLPRQILGLFWLWRRFRNLHFSYKKLWVRQYA